MVAIATVSAAKFTGWYDTAAITAWAEALAARVEPLQRVLAASTDAYLSRLSTTVAGKRIQPAGAIDVTKLRDGVTHAGAYGRAADVYRYQQSQFDQTAQQILDGASPQAPDIISPVDAAVQRVLDVAKQDGQLVLRNQSQAFMEQNEDKGITGYRRVIHPERSKGGTCGLCIAASDVKYHVKELLPLHQTCFCTTSPIFGELDPGNSLNNLDLATLYKQAGGSTNAADLKKTRYQVDAHGELGPVLVPHGKSIHTGRTGRTSTKKPLTAEQKMGRLEARHKSLTATLPKARELAASDPKAWGPFLANIEARIKTLGEEIAA